MTKTLTGAPDRPEFEETKIFQNPFLENSEIWRHFLNKGAILHIFLCILVCFLDFIESSRKKNAKKY